MNRLALVVDDGLFHHSGVRHYVLDLVAVLRRRWHVDLVQHDGLSNDPLTFDVLHLEDEFVADYGFLSDDAVGPEPGAVVAAARRSPRRRADRELVRRRSGRRLTPDHYDAALIYAPWCLDRLPGHALHVPTAMLNFDLIPNQFVLSRANGPLDWAGAHARGLSRALAQTRGVLTISDATAGAVRELFPSSSPVLALPEFLGPHYRDAPVRSDDAASCDLSLVLVGPLDPRKGLRYVPEVVRRLPEVRRVVVLGESRVPVTETVRFFEALAVDELVWMRSCREGTRERLFAESSLLLFPSDEEGLGLPLLEAQVVGLPVAVKDKAPMNHLQLGTCLLTGDADDDAARVRAELQAPHDAADLARRARERWTSDRTYDAVLDTVAELLLCG